MKYHEKDNNHSNIPKKQRGECPISVRHSLGATPVQKGLVL